jgi:hypothetical protein
MFERYTEKARRVIFFARYEASTFRSTEIGTEHLLLGLLREPKSPGGKYVAKSGAKLPELRLKVEKFNELPRPESRTYTIPAKTYQTDIEGTVQIHGSAWKASYVHEAVARLRQYSWHWNKESWAPEDIVVNRRNGTISFDLKLAQDAAEFELVKGGWKKGHCMICRWELFESKDDSSHGEGYTNGRDWICTECYDKFFLRPRFLSAALGEIT